MAFVPYNGVLRECQLNGIPFPVEHVRMNFSQDIVQHKYPNVPGADVESMSRNPVTFSVRAIFLTGLKRAPTETWSDLFPKTFQAVMRTLNDGLNERIKFQHPTLGKFNVKVVHGSTETIYTTRNGQIIEFELIEDGNNDATVQQNILGVDENGTATQSAAALNGQWVTYSISNPQAGLPPTDFTQLLNTALAPIQSTSIAVGTTFASASNAVAQVDRARQQLFSLGDPKNSFMMIEMESISSALNNQITNNNSLNIFNVRQLMTLNQVLLQLLKFNNKLTIERLITINPQLSVSTVLQPNTIVYWQ